MTFMQQYKALGSACFISFIIFFIIILFLVMSDIFNIISRKKSLTKELLDIKVVFNKVIFISLLFISIDGWIDNTSLYIKYTGTELKTKEISIVSLESEWTRPPFSSRRSVGVETIHIHGSDGEKYFVQDMNWLNRDKKIIEAYEIGRNITIKYKELGGIELDGQKIVRSYKIIEQITYN